MNKQNLKSIGAVLSGILAVWILSLATDIVMHATGVFPPWGERMSDGLFLLATGYRTIYGVLGGYVTARLAPGSLMKHALILGAIGIVLGSAGVVAAWVGGPAFGPMWYPLALVALALPQCWAGGMLRVIQLRTTSGTQSRLV